MLHLKPISEKQASKEVQAIYTDIKQTIQVDIVPLVFQYLANFPPYLVHVWGKIKQNLTHTSFTTFEQELKTFSHAAIQEIYQPAPYIQDFVSKLSPHEKQRLQKTIQNLVEVNIRLLIILIGLRESVKGVFIGIQKIPQQTSYSTFFGQEVETSPFYATTVQKAKEENIATQNTMLAPLFGTQTLEVNNIPEFFTLISHETTRMQETESLLTKRVGLEKQTLHIVDRLAFPIGTSYKEFMELTYGNPHTSELLYLLYETFPSTFPRLLLTTTLMNYVLLDKQSLMPIT